MSPLQAQSTTFLRPSLTEELNSELSWTDGISDSSFLESTSRSFGGSAKTPEDPPAPLVDHFSPRIEDDHLDPPPTHSGNWEQINFVDSNANIPNSSVNGQSNNLYAILSHIPCPRQLTVVVSQPHIRLPTGVPSLAVVTLTCRRITRPFTKHIHRHQSQLSPTTSSPPSPF